MWGFLSRPGILNSWLEVVRSCSGCSSSYCLGVLFLLSLLTWQNSGTQHFGRQKPPLQRAKELSISSLSPTVAMKLCIYISYISFFLLNKPFLWKEALLGLWICLPSMGDVTRALSYTEVVPCQAATSAPLADQKQPVPFPPCPSKLLLSWHKWAAPPLAILWAWKPQSSKGEQSRRAVLIVLGRGSFRSLPVFIKA